jgi:quercetin dioxygenase-like cupin family protein
MDFPNFLIPTEGAWHPAGDGIHRRVVHMNGMTVALMRLEAGLVTDAAHHHPHEQAAVVLQGRVRMVIGETARELSAGDGYLVPSNVHHHIEVLEEALVMDVFSPKREDL